MMKVNNGAKPLCSSISSLCVVAFLLFQIAFAKVSILSPKNNAAVVSPVRFDVDVDVSDIRQEHLDHPEYLSLCCLIDNKKEDEICVDLLGGKPLPLIPLERNKKHIIQMYVVFDNGVIRKQYKSSDTEAVFSVFVKNEISVCGPSSTSLSNRTIYGVKTNLVSLVGEKHVLCLGRKHTQFDEDVVVANSVELPKEIWEQHRVEGFSTHQPALIYHTRVSSSHGGDIWELGAGTGSTPLLRILAQESHRLLITVEDSLAFIENMKSMMPPTSFHRYDLVSSIHNEMVSGESDGDSESDHKLTTLSSMNGAEWMVYLNSLNLPLNYEASVVFIDQWPEAARWYSVMFWARKSLFIVVHDSPLPALTVPFTFPVEKKKQRNDHAVVGSVKDDFEVGSDSLAMMSTGVLGTGIDTVSLGLFKDAQVFESLHCKGPATMVFTMKEQCRVGKKENIDGL